MVRLGKIENKVTAASAGAGAGTITASFVLWLLDRYLPGGVPQEVQAFVTFVVASGASFVSGYLARHTHLSEIVGTVDTVVQNVANQVGELLPVPPDLPPASNLPEDMNALRLAVANLDGGTYAKGGVVAAPAVPPAKKAAARKPRVV